MVKLETDATGRHGSPAWWCRATGSRERSYEADVVVVSASTSNSAKLLLHVGQRPPSPTAWPTAPIRSGGTTCSTTPKAVVTLGQGAQRHRVPEDHLPSTTSTSRGQGRQWPLGNIQMVGKSNGWAMKGEEPKLTILTAPHWSLDDVAEHAVDFWLTTEDLPDPANRVTVDGDGHIHLAYTSNNGPRGGPTCTAS